MSQNRILIMLSGTGSNLLAVLENIAAEKLNGTVVGVISDTANAQGLEIAVEAGIATQVVALENLQQVAESFAADLIVLDEFNLALPAEFIANFSGKILNILPSLLPNIDSYKQVIANGAQEHGCTVQFMVQNHDAVILQAKVPVFAEDLIDDLQARVAEQERQIYPLAISWFLAGRLKLRENAVWLDDNQLPPEGYAAD